MKRADIAYILNGLASLYSIQKRYTEAERYYKRTLEIYEKALGEDHLYVAMVLQNMAVLYRNTEEEKHAEILEERANKIQRSNQQPVISILNKNNY